MTYPSTYKFTKDHEWLDVQDGQGRIGITDFAQQQLGDVVYIELPQVGARLKKGDSFGTIESVKAVSELYSPISGDIVAVNTALKEKPEAVNSDPHRSWMISVALSEPDEVGSLLSAADYDKLVG